MTKHLNQLLHSLVLANDDLLFLPVPAATASRLVQSCDRGQVQASLSAARYVHMLCAAEELKPCGGPATTDVCHLLVAGVGALNERVLCRVPKSVSKAQSPRKEKTGWRRCLVAGT